jgi:hypothetical protein
LQLILRQIGDATSHGADVLLGGNRVGTVGAFLEPTILTGISPENPAYRQEFFGPVAPIFPAKDEAEAIAIANDSPFGLRKVGLALRRQPVFSQPQIKQQHCEKTCEVENVLFHRNRPARRGRSYPQRCSRIGIHEEPMREEEVERAPQGVRIPIVLQNARLGTSIPSLGNSQPPVAAIGTTNSSRLQEYPCGVGFAVAIWSVPATRTVCIAIPAGIATIPTMASTIHGLSRGLGLFAGIAFRRSCHEFYSGAPPKAHQLRFPHAFSGNCQAPGLGTKVMKLDSTPLTSR